MEPRGIADAMAAIAGFGGCRPPRLRDFGPPQQYLFALAADARGAAAERLPVDLALAEATDLVDRWGGDVDEPLRNFVALARTRARARRRRRRRIVTATIAALSIFAMLATIAGIVAIKQRNIALVEQASADQTTRFMVSLFALADPSESRGNAVTVREVLDRGAAEVDPALGGRQPGSSRPADCDG